MAKSKARRPTVDYTFANHGSLWLVTPQNQRAAAFLEESVQADAQWMGQALVVEPRYVSALANNLREEGWRL